MNDRHDKLDARIAELEADRQSSRRRMRRLTLTNIVLAVTVLSFGGAGAAYALAAANTVNSASIIDRTIGTPDVKVGAFAGQTILDNSMTTKDINEATLVLTCPSGTVTRVRDVCSTGLKGQATWLGALFGCASTGWRLPSLPEAILVAKATNQAAFLWTPTASSPGSEVALVGNRNSTVFKSIGTLQSYVCVTTVGSRP